MKRFAVFFMLLGAFLLFGVTSNASQDVVMIITGTVQDDATRQAVEGASVSAGVDVSPVYSGKDGAFRFIIMSSAPVMLRVSKQGYESFEKLVTPQERIDLSVKLKPSAQKPTILFSSFHRGSEITGRIVGLTANSCKDYKVLVYVLTDKWYIHPWAQNSPGRGYATIADDGSWRISTVWRGYQAYRVAFLLVKMGGHAPPTVTTYGGDPDADLLVQIPGIAHLIMEAPEGI